MMVKKSKTGEILSIIGIIWTVVSIILTILSVDTTLEFFIFAPLPCFLGTIIFLIAINDYYVDKPKYNISNARELLNNIDMILVIFINIPFISIMVYSILKYISEVFN